MEIRENTPEEILQNRDERVAKILRGYIDDCRSEATELERLAKSLRLFAQRAEQAVKDEQWWELGSVLDREDVESLCNISPKGLLDEEGG